jgi:hypothetical protein
LTHVSAIVTSPLLAALCAELAGVDAVVDAAVVAGSLADPQPANTNVPAHTAAVAHRRQRRPDPIVITVSCSITAFDRRPLWARLTPAGCSGVSGRWSRAMTGKFPGP